MENFGLESNLDFCIWIVWRTEKKIKFYYYFLIPNSCPFLTKINSKHRRKNESIDKQILVKRWLAIWVLICVFYDLCFVQVEIKWSIDLFFYYFFFETFCKILSWEKKKKFVKWNFLSIVRHILYYFFLTLCNDHRAKYFDVISRS